MRVSGMQRSVLKHSTEAADRGCAPLGSRISQLSTAFFQLTEQREAPEPCQKFTGTRTHPDLAAHACAGHCCCPSEGAARAALPVAKY